MIFTLYAAISFLSASFLFIVQPIFAKVALPSLGGASYVWNICMMTFQILLLLGYYYAYQLDTYIKLKYQPLIHITLLACAFLFYPPTVIEPHFIDFAFSPMTWLISLIGINIALPFFVLSATSPLIQKWFTTSTKQDPYILYAASNCGSLLGLISYPILWEPMLMLPTQIKITGYVIAALLFLFMIVGIDILTKNTQTVSREIIKSAQLNKKTVIKWLILSFAPSSLLYAITTHISTDIAPTPLLWVIPLTLYLITLIIVFGRKKFKSNIWHTLHIFGGPIICVMNLFNADVNFIVILTELIIFFAITLNCHNTLAQLKPPTESLASYFLWIALGGSLGGIFNNFIAPLCFNSIFEYPVILMISIAAIAWSNDEKKLNAKDIAPSLAAWSCVIISSILINYGLAQYNESVKIAHSPYIYSIGMILIASVAIIVFSYFKYQSHLYLYLVWISPILFFDGPFINKTDETTLLINRNSYGIVRITRDLETKNIEFKNGITSHGFQPITEENRLYVTSYYHILTEIFNVLPTASHSIATIGLGIGTIACLGNENDKIDFFEINPLVQFIANDTRYFTYMRDCKPQKNTYLGDGRINISKMPNKSYDLIIIDAFNSNSIPVHLLTKEALEIYRSKLKPDGLVAFNISNRHINLQPVLSALASDALLTGMIKFNTISASNKLELSSMWVVLANSEEKLYTLKATPYNWTPLPKVDEKYLWTDDYSNVWNNIIFHY